MASKKLRDQAGGGGAQTVPQTESEIQDEQHAQQQKDLHDPARQAKILNPDFLEFDVPLDEGYVRIAVPTQFTMGDLTQRRIFEDIDSFARLTLIEASRVAPADVRANPALLFERANLPYLEVALARSNVRDLLRETTAKIARVVEDGVPGDKRPPYELITRLSTNDTMTLGVWFFRRWLEARAKEKNGLRTALG